MPEGSLSIEMSEAVISGDLAKIRKLISEGNADAEDCSDAISFACQMDKYAEFQEMCALPGVISEAIQMFVPAVMNGQYDIVDFMGKFPFLNVASKAKILLQTGALVCNPEMIRSLQSIIINNIPALPRKEDLIKSRIIAGDITGLKNLFGHAGITPCYSENYPLRLASACGQLNIVRYLCQLPSERGVDPQENNHYAIRIAAERQLVRIVAVLANWYQENDRQMPQTPELNKIILSIKARIENIKQHGFVSNSMQHILKSSFWGSDFNFSVYKVAEERAIEEGWKQTAEILFRNRRLRTAENLCWRKELQRQAGALTVYCTKKYR